MAAAHLAEDLMEEMTCPVCMDYFTQPVTLGCGHSFCHPCLLRNWTEVDQPSICPECRRAFQMRDLEPNHWLRKLASIASKLRPFLLQIREERMITCEKHKEEQNLFCREDQSFLCAFCFQSQEHSSHTVQPLHEAAEASRDKLQVISDHLWKEVEKAQNMLAKERQKEEVWNQQSNAWRGILAVEHVRLLDFLQDEEIWYFDILAMEERQSLQKFRENELRFSQHLQKVREEIINTKHICQKSNLQLLQLAGETLRRIKSLLNACPQPIRPPVTTTCITAMFEMMNKFRTNVTLDPESSCPYFIVSSDLKTVRNGGHPQNVPVTPEQFDDGIVLGTQVFTSGIHYWEVHVEDSQQWTVGVCKESLSREPDVPILHGDAFMITYIQNENNYTVISNCHQIPRQSVSPIRRVGIFLDYDRGIISFFDALERYFLLCFPHFPFPEPLRPLFSPCPPRKGGNSIPMSIVP